MTGYLIGGRLVAGSGISAGQITVRAVPAISMSGELSLNRDGSIDAVANLPLVDPNTRVKIDLPNELVPGRDFIGWVEDDIIVEAGPIWGDPFTFPSSDRIVANGLWSYFDHRYVLPVLTSDQLPRDVATKWAGISRRTAVKRLVQQACSHPSSALPIDYEPDYPGSENFEYPGSDLKTVGEAMRDITELEGGPDITFRPKWGLDRQHVRWDLLTGNPELKQGGAAHYWDVSVPDAFAAVNSLDRSGSDLSSRDFQTGATFRNLKTNSSFEDDLEGWSGGSNANAPAIGASHPFHGAKYGQWTAVGAGHAWLNSKQTFSVKPGQSVYSSAHMRASAAVPGVAMVRFKKSDGSALPDVMGAPVMLSPNATWTRVGVLTIAPSDANSFEVYFAGIATSSGQVFMADAVTVSLVAEVIPYDDESIELQAVGSDPSLTAAGFPLLESSTARSSVTQSSVLQAYTNESVARASAHTVTWTITARRDKIPRLGTYWPGDYATVRIGTNPRVPADTYEVRILSIQWSRSGDVTIDCAPQRFVSGYPVPSTKRRWFRDRLAALAAAITESSRGT